MALLIRRSSGHILLVSERSTMSRSRLRKSIRRAAYRYRSENLSDVLLSPGSLKNYGDTADTERGHRDKSAEDLEAAFAKLARIFSVPKSTSQAWRARQNGLFRGRSTNYGMKPPGRAASQTAVNPSRNLVSAMNTF